MPTAYRCRRSSLDIEVPPRCNLIGGCRRLRLTSPIEQRELRVNPDPRSTARAGRRFLITTSIVAFTAVLGLTACGSSSDSSSSVSTSAQAIASPTSTDSAITSTTSSPVAPASSAASSAANGPKFGPELNLQLATVYQPEIPTGSQSTYASVPAIGPQVGTLTTNQAGCVEFSTEPTGPLGLPAGDRAVSYQGAVWILDGDDRVIGRTDWPMWAIRSEGGDFDAKQLASTCRKNAQMAWTGLRLILPYGQAEAGASTTQTGTLGMDDKGCPYLSAEGGRLLIAFDPKLSPSEQKAGQLPQGPAQLPQASFEVVDNTVDLIIEPVIPGKKFRAGR